MFTVIYWGGQIIFFPEWGGRVSYPPGISTHESAPLRADWLQVRPAGLAFGEGVEPYLVLVSTDTVLNPHVGPEHTQKERKAFRFSGVAQG